MYAGAKTILKLSRQYWVCLIYVCVESTIRAGDLLPNDLLVSITNVEQQGTGVTSLSS